MADNVIADAGSGGATFAADDISGVMYPRNKLIFGADGVNSGDVSAANPFPVYLVSGVITLPTGAATAANQATEIASLASIDGKVPALGQALAAASVPVVLTASQLSTITPPAAITGFATAANQTTELASLSSIDGKTPALGQALAAASVPVVLTAAQLSTLTPLSTVAVTGVATAANQSTEIASLASIDGHIDGVEGSLTSIDAKITAVNTGAVVIASSALPTGAATAARQDTGNTSLGSIDTKLPALGQALAAASVPVVLTAAQLSTLTPLSAVTVSGTVDTELPAAAALADNTSNPTAPAVGSFLLGWDETDSQWDRIRTSNITGDGLTGHTQGALDVMGNNFVFNGASWDRMRGDTVNGVLVNLGANNDVTDGGGTLTVDAPVGTPVFVRLSDGAAAISTLPVSLASVPSHAVTNAGTFAVQAVCTNAGTFVVQENGAALTALQLIDDVVYTDDTSTHSTGSSKGVLFMAAATPTDTSVSANDIGAVGMTTDRKLHVAVMDALPAGSAAIGKLAANSGVDIGDVDVTSLTGSTIAHDAADSGSPHKVGGRATNVEIAAVANNDRSDLVTTLTGKLITHPWSNPENFVSGAITSAMTGTTSTSLIAAPAAGLRNYITHIVVSNSHATVGTDVVIQDGNGGTTLYTIPAAAVYGGASIAFPVPLRQPTTATAIYCANVTTGASTKVSASGYKAA